jgi:hypothetical protein
VQITHVERRSLFAMDVKRGIAQSAQRDRPARRGLGHLTAMHDQLDAGREIERGDQRAQAQRHVHSAGLAAHATF